MITILDEDFSQLNQYLSKLNPSQLFFLVDENTHNYCLPLLLPNLETTVPFEIIEIEAGEDLKNITTAGQLWEILSEFEADRNALIINLGGGVVTDLGGFVASTYKRGVKFINIPTTLLAMCDASIGGKTGIDHAFLKNIVGTFAQPEKIFVYPKFLKTLPFRELRSGFAEMLKHGLVASASHWENLSKIENFSIEAISAHIEISMNIKQDIVNQDFNEKNIRKVLNFGHTIGHAVESLFLQQNTIIPHGECVAMGMVCETELAYLEQLISEKERNAILEVLLNFYPKLDISNFSNEEILALIMNDKKNIGGNVNFSLLTQIGKGNFDYNCAIISIHNALNFYRTL